MKNVILSIKPEYIEEISKGRKKFEYRKKIFKKKIDRIYIYSTSPVKAIVGEFKVHNIIVDTPEVVWQETNKYSGISRQRYNEYFQGSKKAIALEIDEFLLYPHKIYPQELLPGFYPPQSFRYVDVNFID